MTAEGIYSNSKACVCHVIKSVSPFHVFYVEIDLKSDNSTKIMINSCWSVLVFAVYLKLRSILGD